jgi:hypothetical protein
VSYSVGQAVYNIHAGTNGSKSEGVQQPFEISAVTAIEEANGINLSFLAFPNPTIDYLTLSIDKSDISGLSNQHFDAQGLFLQNEEITGNQIRIYMVSLVPATYYVIVIQGNKEVKAFKIIKN